MDSQGNCRNPSFYPERSSSVLLPSRQHNGHCSRTGSVYNHNSAIITFMTHFALVNCPRGCTRPSLLPSPWIPAADSLESFSLSFLFSPIACSSLSSSPSFAWSRIRHRRHRQRRLRLVFGPFKVIKIVIGGGESSRPGSTDGSECDGHLPSNRGPVR